MMAKKDRSWLKESINSLLLPELQRMGFSVVALGEADWQSAELRNSFPFGRHHRKTQHGIDMIEIQVDTRRPAFRLNVGIAPLDGNKDYWVHYLDEYYTVYRFPRIRKWFSLWVWPGRSVTKAHYESLVNKVIDILPEVNQLFLGKRKIGAHVRRRS